MTERNDLQALRAENTRLVALLEAHDIAWQVSPAAAPRTAPAAKSPVAARPSHQAGLSTADIQKDLMA